MVCIRSSKAGNGFISEVQVGLQLLFGVPNGSCIDFELITSISKSFSEGNQVANNS